MLTNGVGEYVDEVEWFFVFDDENKLPESVGFGGDGAVDKVGDGGTMMIVVGNFNADEEQLTEIYLTHLAEGQSLPKGKLRRLDDHVGESGQTLAMRYINNAEISRDDPTLKIPEIRDALLAMSSSVVEFGTFETPGVEIWFDAARATAATVESDVRNALVITKSMVANRVTA